MLKIVCGAGNEDCESVKRLVYVYAKAGCEYFDISARKDVLDAAKEAVKLAGAGSAHFCVSVGIKGDPHITKAKIKESVCIKCGKCLRNCPNDAIYPSITVNDKRCVGCGTCAKVCPTGAMTMYEKDVNVEEILPYMVENGVEILELHVMGQDRQDMDYKWNVINECNPRYASICVDREYFGNKEAISRIRSMIAHRKPYTTIVQADGIPMSGSDDTYKTTLQAVAMAEIIQNANLPVHIVLSGGTNSKTAELAKICGINYWGIAIGSWARRIVKKYIYTEDFWDNMDAQVKAIEAARELVKSSV